MSFSRASSLPSLPFLASAAIGLARLIRQVAIRTHLKSQSSREAVVNSRLGTHRDTRLARHDEAEKRSARPCRLKVRISSLTQCDAAACGEQMTIRFFESRQRFLDGLTEIHGGRQFLPVAKDRCDTFGDYAGCGLAPDEVSRHAMGLELPVQPSRPPLVTVGIAEVRVVSVASRFCVNRHRLTAGKPVPPTSQQRPRKRFVAASRRQNLLRNQFPSIQPKPVNPGFYIVSISGPTARRSRTVF